MIRADLGGDFKEMLMVSHSSVINLQNGWFGFGFFF